MPKNTVLTPVEKARILFETRKYEALLSELPLYLANHQEDGDARFLLAESLWRVGKKAEALRQFDKCFDGKKSKRDVAVHVCSLLYHEASIANFYWSDIIYWCLSAAYCGASVDFVKGLLAKFCGNQVSSIDDELFKSHHEWLDEVKTLTNDVKELRLSLKSIIRTTRKLKSVNIHHQGDHIHTPHYQGTSQFYNNYFNSFIISRLNNHEMNTYFDTNVFQTFNGNNNCDVNISSHSTYNSIEDTSFNNRTKLKSTRHFVFASKPIKKYQRLRSRIVFARKLRKDLFTILNYFRNTNVILQKCASYTHTKALHYMTYISGIKYMNDLPNTIRFVNNKNRNCKEDTNNYNFTSSIMSVDSRSNVEKAIDNFCTDNKVILERLSKKCNFDTKVANFNALAKFCNDRDDILKGLRSRSIFNEVNVTSGSEVTHSNRKNTIISDNSCSRKSVIGFSQNSLDTNKDTLKMPGATPKKNAEETLYYNSSNVQNISKNQIYKTLYETVPSSIIEEEKHELNILVDKSYCDHEIISNIEVTDIYTNNVIQHNNMIEMISCKDLEHKQTSTELGNNKIHINCVKQKNTELSEFTKNANMGKNTCFYANNDIMRTSTNESHNDSNINNCFVNINKCDQTTLANTSNNTQYDHLNIYCSLITGIANNTNNASLSECYEITETFIPYKDSASTVNLKEYHETQKSTVCDLVQNTMSLYNDSSNSISSDAKNSEVSNRVVCLNTTNWETYNTMSDNNVEDSVLAFNHYANTYNLEEFFEAQNRNVCVGANMTVIPLKVCSKSNISKANSSTVTDRAVWTGTNNNSSISDESKETIPAFNISSKITNSDDFFKTQHYKTSDEVDNYDFKCHNFSQCSKAHSSTGSNNDVNSSELEVLYKNNDNTTPCKLAYGHIETHSSNKYSDEVKYSNISSVAVGDYAALFNAFFNTLHFENFPKMQRNTNYGENEIRNPEYYHETNIIVDCSSVECLITPNSESCIKTQTGTVCNKVNSIITCNGPTKTFNSVENFKSLIMEVCKVVNKNVLKLNLQDICEKNISVVLNKVKEVVLTDHICLNIFQFEENLGNQDSLVYRIEENVQYDGLFGVNFSLLQSCKSQNVGFITELDNSYANSSKTFDDIFPAIQDSISLCENIATEYDSQNVNQSSKGDMKKIENVTYFIANEITRILENVNRRIIRPSMYNIDNSNLNIFYGPIRPCHLEQSFTYNLSTLKQQTSNLSCIQDLSSSCVKLCSSYYMFHSIFDDKISEISWWNESSDSGYDSEVSVHNKTIPNTQNFSWNADEKYHSWATNKKRFNGKVWSTYFNSIVKKYLYKTYIPHYVNPKVDLSIYLSNINIDQSTTSLDSFKDALKIYDILNNKRNNICQDQCTCHIDHLIYTSFLNAAVPDLRAIHLFCDPSKLLVQNLCQDIFAKPIFNGTLRFGCCIPKNITKVKDSTFLLVNLCNLKQQKK